MYHSTENLSETNELDAQQLIENYYHKGTLESYVAATRAKKEKNYAHPYPIMLQLLEAGLKANE